MPARWEHYLCFQLRVTKELNLAFTLVGSCLVADTTLTLTDHHDPHVKTESIQSGLIGLSEPDNLCFYYEITIYSFINQRDQISKFSKSGYIFSIN